MTHDLVRASITPELAALSPARHDTLMRMEELSHHDELARTTPEDTSLRAILPRAFHLVQRHPTETIGYGLVLGAVAMGVNSFLQMFFQGALMMSMVGGMAASGLSEALGMGVIFGGITLAMVATMGAAIGVNAVAMGAYHILWLKLLRGESVTLNDGFQAMRLWKPLTAVSALTTLAIMTGGAAAIIPGVLAMLGLLLAPMLVVDHGLDTRQALRQSWALTRGHRLRLLGLLGMLIIINSLGVVSFGLGLFISYPLSIGCMVAYYNAITRPGPPGLLAVVPAPTPHALT